MSRRFIEDLKTFFLIVFMNMIFHEEKFCPARCLLLNNVNKTVNYHGVYVV